MELAWICEESGRQFQRVPQQLAEEAGAWLAGCCLQLSSPALMLHVPCAGLYSAAAAGGGGGCVAGWLLSSHRFWCCRWHFLRPALLVPLLVLQGAAIGRTIRLPAHPTHHPNGHLPGLQRRQPRQRWKRRTWTTERAEGHGNRGTAPWAFPCCQPGCAAAKRPWRQSAHAVVAPQGPRQSHLWCISCSTAGVICGACPAPAPTAHLCNCLARSGSVSGHTSFKQFQGACREGLSSKPGSSKHGRKASNWLGSGTDVWGRPHMVGWGLGWAGKSTAKRGVRGRSKNRGGGRSAAASLHWGGGAFSRAAAAGNGRRAAAPRRHQRATNAVRSSVGCVCGPVIGHIRPSA